jgi:hypothetical protein
MKRCGAGAVASEEYGNPSGVRISRLTAIRNIPLRILRIFSGFFTSKMRGTWKNNTCQLHLQHQRTTHLSLPSSAPKIQQIKKLASLMPASWQSLVCLTIQP